LKSDQSHFGRLLAHRNDPVGWGVLIIRDC